MDVVELRVIHFVSLRHSLDNLWIAAHEESEHPFLRRAFAIVEWLGQYDDVAVEAL